MNFRSRTPIWPTSVFVVILLLSDAPGVGAAPIDLVGVKSAVVNARVPAGERAQAVTARRIRANQPCSSASGSTSTGCGSAKGFSPGVSSGSAPISSGATQVTSGAAPGVSGESTPVLGGSTPGNTGGPAATVSPALTRTLGCASTQSADGGRGEACTRHHHRSRNKTPN